MHDTLTDNQWRVPAVPLKCQFVDFNALKGVAYAGSAYVGNNQGANNAGCGANYGRT
jgi:hypothetical protein